MTSILSTALAFARYDIGSFPCHWPLLGRDGKFICSCGRLCGNRAAKHPFERLAPKGCYSATTDVGVLKHQFGYVVPEANLAIHADKLIIVDIDPRHSGDETFAALIKEHGELPPTWRVITGGGGEHIYFAAPESISIKNYSYKPGAADPPLGPGIDIRARGGYAITPPSRHISGGVYAWSVDHHPADVPLAAPPAWLIEKLTASKAVTVADSTHEPLSLAEWASRLRPASEYPDDIACAIAGHLFAYGIASTVALGLMRPWARESGLDQQELERIVDRVAAKEAAKRRARLA